MDCITCTLKVMLTEISNLKIFFSLISLSSNWQISDSHAFWREKMELVFFIQNLELKAIWLLKFQLKIMTVLSATYSPQVLFFSSCMLEIHLLKRPYQTILITNFWKIKNLILFGKPTQEEDQLTILVNNLKTFSAEWLLTILLKDQKFKKSLHILGLRVQYVLTVK